MSTGMKKPLEALELLREHLFLTLSDLRSNKISRFEASTTASLAREIIDSYRVGILYDIHNTIETKSLSDMRSDVVKRNRYT